MKKMGEMKIYAKSKQNAGDIESFLKRVLAGEVILTEISRNEYSFSGGRVKGATVIVDFEETE